jgi:hypothetical protein
VTTSGPLLVPCLPRFTQLLPSHFKPLEIIGAPEGIRTCDSTFEGQRRGPTAARATLLTSYPDSEERTGIRFEKERGCGYSGGALALPGRPLAPAIAPIRGSRR